MKKSLLKNLKYLITISLSLFLFGGQPAEFGEEKTFFHGYLIPKPIIRIGIGVNLGEIKISSSSGVKIYEVKTNYKLIADDADEVMIKGHREKLNEKYVIQVAQSKEREEAEILAQDLKTRLESKVYVKRSSEERIVENYQVIVGDFLTRGDALDHIKKLNQIGINDTWIIREDITEEESKPLWILINDELKSLSDDTVLYFIPSNPQSYLSFNGRDYRGIFVLNATSQGLVLTNILNLDDYLKGVVPSEMSPYDFREIEAHKAQAVAARTYAIKNMKSNEELGFDLCDTPKSQYYKGMNAEHPLSSQAVDETKGMAAVYRGKLINALYTSTCGGMTENAEDVFGGTAVPYLKATECVYEKNKGWSVKSGSSLLPIYINGRNIASEIASLQSLGVISLETDPVFYREKAHYKDAVNWIYSALGVLGKASDPLDLEPEPLNCLSLSHLIVQAFGWQERVESLLLESETDFLLNDVLELQNGPRDDLAYLIQTGILPSSQNVMDPERDLSKGELLYYLWKVILNHRNLSHEGIFKGHSDDKIVIEESQESRQITLSPQVYILKNYDGDHSFVSKVYLLGGEKIRWLEDQEEIKFLEVIYPPHTNILDRSSDYHSWQSRISREKLQRRINQYYPIGELVDMAPQKKGVSNRVIDLMISGTEADASVKGFRIRTVLGLRETLFVIDREYDEEGKVTHFTFHGKGWGHGVGLCQVGAFGLAQAGVAYQDILKKYYKGIKIEKIY